MKKFYGFIYDSPVEKRAVTAYSYKSRSLVMLSCIEYSMTNIIEFTTIKINQIRRAKQPKKIPKIACNYIDKITETD